MSVYGCLISLVYYSSGNKRCCLPKGFQPLLQNYRRVRDWCSCCLVYTVPQLEPAFTLFSQHTKHIWVKSINGMGTHTHPPPHTQEQPLIKVQSQVITLLEAFPLFKFIPTAFDLCTVRVESFATK